MLAHRLATFSHLIVCSSSLCGILRLPVCWKLSLVALVSHYPIHVALLTGTPGTVGTVFIEYVEYSKIEFDPVAFLDVTKLL